MARVNIYLPDDLADDARVAGLNVSAIAQAALRAELKGGETSAWLRRSGRHRSRGISHDEVLAALDAVRAEAGDDWPEPADR